MNFAVKLSNGFGPSGCETEIRELIKQELKEYNIKFKTTFLGSLIATKEGKIKDQRVIITAHTDEVGFIISKINNDGTLSFRKLGGIDDRILPSKKVVIGRKRTKGIIMFPPIHLFPPKDIVKLKDLRIFIGATTMEQAAKKVTIGDYATFATKGEIRNGQLWGKALDDRIGCFVLSEILKKNWNIGITGIFNSQEEVGCRGIKSALHNAKGTYGLAIEGTTAYDIDDSLDISPSTELGLGPAITIIDRMSIGNPNMIKLMEFAAKKKKIPFQYKRTATGGTETYFLLRNKQGLPALCISVPVRYIHSPLGMCLETDVKNTISIIEQWLLELEKKVEEK